MAKQRNRPPALIGMRVTVRQALHLAEEYRDAVLARQERLAALGQSLPETLLAIYTEEWQGDLTQGRWRRLTPARGGFCHIFAPEKSQSRRPFPRSGEAAQCRLLEKKNPQGRLAGPTAGP